MYISYCSWSSFDPVAFFEELADVEKNVQVTPNNLKLVLTVQLLQVITSFLDATREGKSTQKIGTTCKGIGPCYEDKTSRKGLKLGHLLNKEILTERLKVSLEEKIPLFESFYKVEYPAIEEEVERLFELGKKLEPFLCDTFSYLDKASSEGKNILYEGAQGILLDIDYGSYPYVTSSNTTTGGIHTGSLAPGGKIDEVIGIAMPTLLELVKDHSRQNCLIKLVKIFKLKGMNLERPLAVEEDVAGLIFHF